MGSTRLKGKVLKQLCGKSVLEHIILRVRASQNVDDVIVATTNNQIDDAIYKFCIENDVKCFRGSENDVLERYYLCAKEYHADIVIRVTADDPFKDPEVIDQAIDLCIQNRFDYVSNTIEPSYPEGIDIEVFKMSALERAYREALLVSEREHVTPYIWKSGDKFRLHNFKYSKDLSGMRWTLDTEDDYQFAKNVYEALYTPDNLFLMSDIIEYLISNPEVEQINSGHVRNEGYLKSIKEDCQKEY